MIKSITSMILTALAVTWATVAAAACAVPDPAPHLVSDEICAERDVGPIACRTWRDNFSTNWRAALGSGNVDAMRRVAYQLAVDDHRVLNKNPMLACAFRLAILDSGDLTVVQSDQDWVTSACGALLLDANQRMTAIGTFDTISGIVAACTAD